MPDKFILRLTANIHQNCIRFKQGILIPWVSEPDWTPNETQFISEFRRFEIDLNAEIILICRSGYRSDDAGKCLINNGFSNIAHVTTGFEGDLDENHQRGNINGWRHDGLEWEQC